MDPITLVGILGSVVSISDVVARSIKKLVGLRSAYRDAPMVVTVLVGQLHIIQSALDQLSSVWDSRAFERHPRYQQLAVQMGTALESFGPLMLSLQTKLDDLDVRESFMTIKKKFSFLWNEAELTNFLTLVDRQVNALNLLLQTIQCSTWAHQQRIIDDDDSRHILQLARDCSSSIIGVLDHQSAVIDHESIMTENTNGMSIEFAFDTLILGCKPYLSAHRSNLRRAIRSTRLETSSDDPLLPLLPDLEISPLDGIRDGPTDQVGPSTAKSISALSIGEGTIRKAEAVAHSDLETLPIQLLPNFVKQLVNTLDEIVRTRYGTATSISPLSEPLGSLNKRTARGFWSGRRARSHEIQTPGRLSTTKETSRHVNTILLGAGESGKSTVFKGFKLLMDGDYTLKQRNEFKDLIFNNIITAISIALSNMGYPDVPLNDPKLSSHAQTILELPDQVYEQLPAKVAAAIKALWADRDFRKCYKRDRENQFHDNLEYYATSIERMERTDYVPSTEDILRTRKRTTGITETNFSLNSFVLNVCDPGGVRSERKKWIHCFEHRHLIVFTVDAAAYNRPLLEDAHTILMQEQLDLFQPIVNSHWFVETKFILLFTKVDLIEQRLSEMHPAHFFTDLEPRVEQRTPTVDEYMKHVERRFLSLVPPGRQHQLRVAYANLASFDTYGPVAQDLLKTL